MPTAGSGRHYLAQTSALLGNKKQALDDLQNSYLKRDPDLTRLRIDPLLSSLHDEPRFRELNAHCLGSSADELRPSTFRVTIHIGLVPSPPTFSFVRNLFRPQRRFEMGPGQSDRGPSLWPRPQRSPERTSCAHPNFRRPRTERGVGRSNRRSDRLALLSSGLCALHYSDLRKTRSHLTYS